RRGGARTWSTVTSARRARTGLWVADITYLRCWEGVVFFAFVIDAYSRRIVGWQLASHMRPHSWPKGSIGASWSWPTAVDRCNLGTDTRLDESLLHAAVGRGLGGRGRRHGRI